MAVKRLVGWSIGWYQQYSRLRPPSCRFLPTCSEYAADAVKHHGLTKGGFLATKRVIRCNPWGGSGYDPVPKSGISNDVNL